MKRLSNIELKEQLTLWYKANLSNPSIWSNNPIGIYLKDILLDRGNWKNAPRGNPRKGGNNSKLAKWKKQNPNSIEENDSYY